MTPAAQQTISTEATLSGKGLHLGEEATLRLLPAEADSGIVFRRTDLDPGLDIPLGLDTLRKQPRRTSFGIGNAEVHTCEHLLSVLHVLGIENLICEIDGPEIPGMDGSALPFLEEIATAGLVDQGARGRTLNLSTPVAAEEGSASVVALPADQLRVTYTLQYAGDPGFSQTVDLEITEESFREQIAPARTFVLESEVKELKARGLGKGATEENTLLLDAAGQSPHFRLPDEPARHKILDLLGDIYLLRCKVGGHIIAHRSGHGLNADLAARIAEAHVRERELEDVLIKAPHGLEIRDIQKMLPHRYPFLLVDRILEVDEGQRAVGLKNVSFNEEYFQGHFPGQPVMPGVLQLEALAQLSGVLLLRSSADSNRIAYILGMDDVKFRKTVVPGDQLILEAELKRMRERTAQVQVRATVEGRLVTEATIRFMIVEAG
ncbi:MAG: UDP-3-O-[3-hydroxymyristoyl] N-acetylglucosamine deacetylase [Planctomycetes bacterium]|nr:UDP-3-O-[3-hydroxymyristoyl] N-acetylglucosamine deacetylase [Planctomycetota bacterium]MBT6452895.1 UDP-3-O-[3-hydroxymyristoyl] N-acetylglucosamine deacetylase [Planctomycetota bacterium]MBT6783688.1 UDP-3-O-[3-hydroxymyristoyl] N-acetylglucosamine deacetylase [Planctomycetota bacterium]MBT6967490.1 UDP-3-O-[3-hydroxymyristoyl] N-acetylglucosamine deacetylase [Planctomycetota bacterium]MBT7103096.1 UDP-3-O-[3-hydroxymyristoyl] N-acetylglucosamine deacetylase [Planctomycetota bacterium]